MDQASRRDILQKTGLLIAALVAMFAGLNQPSAAMAKRHKQRKPVRASGQYGRHGSSF